MSTKPSQKPKLKVGSAGKRQFIDVPEGLSGALHQYLRSHHVRSAPPEPSSTGTDTIELGLGVDGKEVQALLNRWA